MGSPFAPLRGWFPIEVFHFPLRTAEQTAHKAYLQGTAFQQHIDRAPTAYHRNMFAALNGGQIGDYYASLVVNDDELDRGVAEGGSWSTLGYATRYVQLPQGRRRRFRSRRS